MFNKTLGDKKVNKTKIFLASVLAGSLLVSGCASKRDPMQFSGENNDKTLAQVRNAVIQAAHRNDWLICEEADGTLRADIIHRQDKVYADIHYDETGFLVTPNLKYSTLVNDDGSVRRAVNNHVKRLSKLITLRLANKVQEEPILIPACRNYDSVEFNKFGSERSPLPYVTVGFTWLNKPVRPYGSVTLSYSLPEEEVGSAFSKAVRYSLEYLRNGTSRNGEKINVEVRRVYPYEVLKGDKRTLNLPTRTELMIRATAYNREGVKLCEVDVSAHTNNRLFHEEDKQFDRFDVDGLIEGLAAVLERKLTTFR